MIVRKFNSELRGRLYNGICRPDRVGEGEGRREGGKGEELDVGGGANSVKYL